MQVSQRKSIALLAVAVFLASALAGCSVQYAGPPSTPTEKGKTIKVAMIPRFTASPYFAGARLGAAQVAPGLKIDLVYNGPREPDAAAQASLIRGYTARGYNVIAVSPDDTAVVAPAMEAALKAGVHVITWEADTAPHARQFFVDPATPEDTATALVKLVSAHSGGKPADIGVLVSTDTDRYEMMMLQAMVDAIRQKYPNVHIQTIQYDQGSLATGMAAVQTILETFPTVKTLVSLDWLGMRAAAQAVERAGDQGRIVVTGLADPAGIKPYVDDGTVRRYVLWNMADLGRLTMYVARAAADGTMPGDGVFDAGSLGGLQVRNRIVSPGPPVVFDRTTTDQTGF